MLTDLKLYYIDNNTNSLNKISAFSPFLYKCTQTLFSVKKDYSLIKNIYGHSIALHSSAFKYGSIISGQGICPPSSEILKPGVKLEVHCIQPLYTLYTQGPKIVSLERPCVPNSAFLIHNTCSTPLTEKNNGRCIEVLKDTEGFVSYCPILFMTLMTFDIKFTQDQGEFIQWSITLEEF
ncbi:hypothetical protein K737_300530 [Holospora undulata HU1]|uniref:Uncharacterized protein n=1 Tax=Holospora undulata HU1 TaxID=1321371 RepID=A0A061JGC0_9PROT|nr:hypothetical protein K737_300530 [Holospora undulata HU1]